MQGGVRVVALYRPATAEELAMPDPAAVGVAIDAGARIGETQELVGRPGVMAAKSLDGGAGRRAACASNDSRPETPCWASRVSDAGVVAAANRWRSGWAAA